MSITQFDAGADCYSQSIRALRTYAAVVLAVSLFFWGWAILNTVRSASGFDLGVASFLTVALSSALLLWQARPDRGPPGWASDAAVVLSHLFVSINFALGALYGLREADPPRVGFGVYCVVFSVLWLAAGVWGRWLVVAARQSARQKGAEEDMGLTEGRNGDV